MIYRIVVDPMKCESNARCVEVAAGLVRASENGGPAIALDVFGIEQEPAARAAVKACPMAALSIETVAET